ALVTRFVIVGMMPWPEGLQRRAHASDIGEPRTLEFVEPREEWKLQPSAAKSSAVMPHVLTATAARLVQTERRIMQVRTGVAPAFPLTASHAICKLRDAVLVVLAQLIGLAAGPDTDNRIATSQR